MPLLDKLERRLGRFAIPNLSIYLVVGQVFVLLTAMLGLLDPGYFLMAPVQVTHGEWWRLVTFIFMPPPGSFGASLTGYVFLAFGWYMFALMGGALEGFWGEFRFNLFIFTGYVLTVAAAFLTPGNFAPNLFIAGSVFLAFAWLNPDFELMIFFILPVKIKWLALLTWLGYAYNFFTGTPPTRWQIAASVSNFLIFFARDIVQTMRHRKRTMSTAAKRIATANDEPEARHRCVTCGKTNLTHPQMDFRYCSKCAGDQCYCTDHIFAHEHVLTDSAVAKK